MVSEITPSQTSPVEHAPLLGPTIPDGWSLAYIGTALSTAQRDELEHRSRRSATRKLDSDELGPEHRDRNSLVPARNADPENPCVLTHANKEEKPRSGVSVPGHALRCGPETSVTSPLRWLWFELSRHQRTYIQSSRPWECGNPKGISKECGKGGKPASRLSMLSILCHFHGLLFARRCWMNGYATQRKSPHPPRNAYRDQLSVSALAILRQARIIRGDTGVNPD